MNTIADDGRRNVETSNLLLHGEMLKRGRVATFAANRV
jgi:hypothetical protein